MPMSTLRITDRHIKFFRRLFVCREDRYALQWCREASTGYRAVEEAITDEIIARHLRGGLTSAATAPSPAPRSGWRLISTVWTSPRC